MFFISYYKFLLVFKFGLHNPYFVDQMKKANYAVFMAKEIIKKTPQVLKKFEELEFFTKAGVGHKLHYEFLKNFNSQETRKAYYADLKHFFDFYKMAFKKTIRHPSDVTRAEIVAYKDFLIDCGGFNQQKASNLTVRRKMATLSSYFKFMLERDIVKYNPVDGIKRPKKSATHGTDCLNENQVRLLLDYLNLEVSSHPSFTNHLHKAMIYTLFFTGIRVTELISIKRGDYTLYHGKAVLKIRAKGGKYRMIPVHLELQTVLEEYLDSLRAKLRELKRSRLKSDDHLFFSLKNNRNKERPNISRYGVYKILNKRAFQAGIRQKISPHSARATLITSLLSQGQDLYRVSLSVGHAQPETTKIYDKRKRAVHDNAILDLEY
ncbi:MAG: hypothetical protein CME66_09690 [Halobacteriovoraceae bacterium]|nr:hypothetical protein [Halobacteriovoraceae bacterium]